MLHTKFPAPLSEITASDRWEGELQQTKRDGTLIIAASRWTTLRNLDSGSAEWLEINTDITARKQAEEAARRLSGRLLQLQDEERRKIARELHDSLGQYLTGLKINLEIAPTIAEKDKPALLAECSRMVDECLSETRTISYLLHPIAQSSAAAGRGGIRFSGSLVRGWFRAAQWHQGES